MAYDTSLREVFKVKTPTDLARELGITPSAVTQWRSVPLKWLNRVSAITGIPVEQLLPDTSDGDRRSSDRAA